MSWTSWPRPSTAWSATNPQGQTRSRPGVRRWHIPDLASQQLALTLDDPSAPPPHRQGPPTGGPVGTHSGLDGSIIPVRIYRRGGSHAGAGSWRARAPSALPAVWLDRDPERPWRDRGGASSQADHLPLSPMQPPARPAGGSPEGGDRAAATNGSARPAPLGATPASRRTAPGAGQASALA